MGSGRILCHRVGFGFATRCAPVNPLGRGTGRLGRTCRMRAVRTTRPRCGFGPNAGFEIINSFLFQICFINYKSNLIFNDFYSHNKIQEHFITPRKICNSMNATNNFLFKYITLKNSILFQNQGVTYDMNMNEKI
jgi:hypothetical protein